MNGHVEWIEVMTNAYILVRNLQKKRSLDKPKLAKGGGGGVIKRVLRKEDCEDMNRIHLVGNRIEWRDLGWL